MNTLLKRILVFLSVICDFVLSFVIDKGNILNQPCSSSALPCKTL